MDRDLVVLQNTLPSSWAKYLQTLEVKLLEVKQLLQIEQEKIPGLKTFPNPGDTFRALMSMEIDDVKVIIIGQDCYHQEGQAIGRAFGVPGDIRNPPSLLNIIRDNK
jgi:uracil-DNA glycosylase